MGEINPEMGSKSAEIAVLHVNPTTQATEMLILTPKDTQVPKHWHSANETIAVIHGTFIVAHEGDSDRVSLVHRIRQKIHPLMALHAGIPWFQLHQGAGTVNRLNASVH